MDLKKTYKENIGYTNVVTERNSVLTYEELDFLMLEEDQSYLVKETGKEFALVVIYGTCKVEGEGFCFERVGVRKNVFEGPAEVVYVGKDTNFKVTGIGGKVKIAVCKAKADNKYEPVHVKAADIPLNTYGKGACVRQVAVNLSGSVKADRLFIGEFWVEDGKWGSYPPHKHDVNNMPKEGFLDEIYYYEFDKPQGFGCQMVYTKDGTINEAYKVESGDMVEVPRGYHPFACAPGYKNYCLWIMAGENRGLLSTFDEDHKWFNN